MFILRRSRWRSARSASISPAAAGVGPGPVDFAGGRGDAPGLAQGFGADLIEGGFPERLGPYPVTGDASASHEGLACALRSTAPDGVCTSVGIYYERETPVPLLEM